MNAKNILKIRRTNGTIELVDITAKWPVIRKEDFEKMVNLNREHGRGEILGFAEGGCVAETCTTYDDTCDGRKSRATIAAIMGGSLNENDDTSARAMRGGY